MNAQTAETVADMLVPGEAGSDWHVFRTRPRREKKAAELLASLGVRHYLPLRDKVTRRAKRRFTARVPLFPGYLFACCDGGDRLRAMRSGHFAQWLLVKDQERLLNELRGIDIALTRGTGVELFPKLTRGQWVRVVAGPLQGVCGRISRRDQRYRIVLELTALQAAVVVQVDMADVEPVDGPLEQTEADWSGVTA